MLRSGEWMYESYTTRMTDWTGTRAEAVRDWREMGSPRTHEPQPYVPGDDGVTVEEFFA